MTFVFPILLGGLVVAGVPILLHLILRQKPKTLPFPAFRFLVQKHRSNLRKLQLRHLLLLILRVVLIAAVCLALARPKLFHDSFNLSRERPVAAVLVFDTRPTMDYRQTDKVSRLDEAKKRGLEMIGELPDGSRIMILDTADAPVSDRGDWLTSPSEVRKRIDKLKIKPVNGSAPRSVEQALRQLQTLARGDDETLRTLPRLVCVLSDRTVGSWPGGAQRTLNELADQLPATLEGVQQLRATAGPNTELLKELRAQLPPPAGKDYPEQALIESIQTLRDRAGNLRREELPTDEALHQIITKTRRQTRELRDTLLGLGEQKTPEVEEYRTKTLASLHGLLRHLAGAQLLYLDVGVEQPVDVALLKLELPRLPDGQMQQQFAADDKFIVRVLAQALGREVSTALECRVGKEKITKQIEFKAGEQQTIPFEIDLAKLNFGVGAHALEVRLTSKDGLESNNQLYATFQIRQPKRVLVLADTREKGIYLDRALTVLGYAGEIKTVADLPRIDWLNYEAVFLLGVAAPSAALWQAAEAYVQKGGGLAIIPGGDEMQPAKYHDAAAQKLMPGTWKQVVKMDTDKPGASWKLDDDSLFQHPLLRPFQRWLADPETDFFHPKLRRWAHNYWQVAPAEKNAAVLVRYAEKGEPPALVERVGLAGKVLLFTTTLDARAPEWNNYLQGTSFYLALTFVTAKYLTGEAKGVNLNFQCGIDEPRLPLPLTPRFPAYTLRGADLFETLAADADANELRLKQAAWPGNYQVEGVAAAGQKGTPVGAFSVNLAPPESDLTRVPAVEVEAVFGQGSVVATERGVDLRELLKGQWNEPLELFPYLMILLLFVLALENMLANKFYRRED